MPLLRRRRHRRGEQRRERRSRRSPAATSRSSQTADLDRRREPEPRSLRQDADAHGGALRRPSRAEPGDFDADRRIFWESTVIMLGEPNPMLVVDASGTITKLVNVIVTDELGTVVRRSTATDPGRTAQIWVGDIQYDRARLRALPRQQPRRERARRARSGATPACSTTRRPGTTSRSSTRPTGARHAPDRRGQRRAERDHHDQGRPRPGRRSTSRPTTCRSSESQPPGVDVRVRHQAQLRADAGRDPQPPARQTSRLRHRPRGPADDAEPARTASRSRTRSARRSSTTSAAASSSAPTRRGRSSCCARTS